MRRWLCLVTVGAALASCTSDGSSADTTQPVTTEPASTEAPVTTEVPVATDAPVATEVPALSGDGLELGLLAPAPGLLSTVFLGQVRGVDAAALDIADGGGVLDGPLTVTTTRAPLAESEADVVQDALDAGAQVLIGPTGATGADRVRAVVADAGAIACSASVSTPALTAGQDRFGLFRTALPADVLVSYLADEIIARRDAEAPDADWSVAIVARSDEYGQSVGNTLAASLEARGLTPSVVPYNPFRVVFVGLASEVTSLRPDLTVIVSYEEGAAIVSELVSNGVDPASMIGLDSFIRPRIATIAAPGDDATVLDGFTMIGTTGNLAFLQRLFDDDDNGEVAGAAQAYDCAIVFALASQAVSEGSSVTISEAVRDVTAGGTTCTTYADCLEKLRAGEDIDYDGATGKIAIDEAGDPTFGRFTMATLDGGELTNIETADVDIAEIRREQAAFASASFTTKVQQALAFLGFYDGPVDGLQSPELTAALAAFQESVGLPPTGVYDAATDVALRAALGEFSDLLTTSTADLQTLLTELGYYEGPIDGIWSADLTDAMKALQRDLGVPETGILDAATVRAAYEQGVLNGTPPPTTEPPTTEPPTTEPPVTEPPVTEPPTTEPPTTEPPTTEPPTTEPPTTEPPTTEPPTPEPPLERLLATLQADPDFSNFVELVLLSGFGDEIDEAKRYTVFAPTDDVFTDDVLDELRNDPERVRAALGYYVVEGEFPADSLTPGLLPTINGSSLEVVGSGAELRLQDAAISKPDIFASNGVIHGIADFLVPPG
jgi:branched-chain amino acid transport system substrate-binding protein